MGLVSPARKGSSKHRPRLYSDRDIKRVLSIRKLMRDLGVSLAGVAAIVRLHNHIERRQQAHDETREKRPSDHARERQRLKGLITRLQGGDAGEEVGGVLPSPSASSWGRSPSADTALFVLIPHWAV